MRYLATRIPTSYKSDYNLISLRFFSRGVSFSFKPELWFPHLMAATNFNCSNFNWRSLIGVSFHFYFKFHIYSNISLQFDYLLHKSWQENLYGFRILTSIYIEYVTTLISTTQELFIAMRKDLGNLVICLFFCGKYLNSDFRFHPK